MTMRGSRGAYRKEDRVALPRELQKGLVEKAASRFGNCQELAKFLNIPKSSVHYYRIGRLTLPVSILERMLEIANDGDLTNKVRDEEKRVDRTWANAYAMSFRVEEFRQKVRLPTREDLEMNDDLRRKAAAIISYVMAEGSIWMMKEKWGEHAANITFSDEETDLYEHFRGLCVDVFNYDIGPPEAPGNGAKAIRGFIYSRFIVEWLVDNGIPVGEKAAREVHLPKWVTESKDQNTWTNAVQPWCDGEGSVRRPSISGPRSFTLTQSRHTWLDLLNPPRHLCFRGSGRTVSGGSLRNVDIFGVPALTFLAAFSRSEILDDVLKLLRRLGLHPRIGVASIYLKDDGFWSVVWKIGMASSDTRLLDRLSIVTQRKKRTAIRSCAD
ncbi:MAG TPA: hypothetical protein VGB78_01605 [Thermoplasmata archaeon]|jgi:hypothetical protein